jgi:hypothetical protein
MPFFLKNGWKMTTIHQLFSGIYPFDSEILAKLQTIFGQPIIVIDQGFDTSGVTIY